MVNQGKKDLELFIRSGAILSDGDGYFWLLTEPKPVSAKNENAADLVLWFQDFGGSPQAYCSQQIWRGSWQDLQGQLDQLEATKPSLENPVEEKGLFQEFFNESKTLISSGKLSKVVPYSFKTYNHSLSLNERVYLLKNVLEFSKKTGTYVYGFWNEVEGFMGATPEILFEKNSEGALVTRALAGTRSNLENPESLLSDEKEMSEHEFVIEGIVARLQDLGQIEIGETGLKRLPRFSHLETSIEIKNVKADFQKIMKRLHPTPALGGFPQGDARDILKSFDERLPRKNFGAPFGLSLKGERDLCVVMIRGLRWDQAKIQIGAGCGVVAESEFEKEWKEEQIKIQSIEEAMGLT